MRGVPQPMLASAGTPPRGSGWSFEIKFDGVRAMVQVSARTGLVRIFSRHGVALTASFPEVAADLLAALADHDDVLLDGELVTPDRHGRPVFARMQRRIGVGRPAAGLLREVPASFYAFDLLVDGEDITHLPYRQRRVRLEQLPLEGRHLACPPSWTDTDIDTVLAIAADGNFEGAVAKRDDSSYRPGRSTAWVKCVLRKRAEVVVGGWLPASRSRGTAVGALLVGAYDADGNLTFLGAVGTGFTAAERRRLATRLSDLVCAACPFEGVPEDAAHARWVHPRLVGAVEYREFTTRLRHPSWKGERFDVSPDAVLVQLLA
jgi:bifunctional non-homologous end joining protein LigD